MSVTINHLFEKIRIMEVFITQGSAEELPYEDGKFDLVTAVETVYRCKSVVPRILEK